MERWTREFKSLADGQKTIVVAAVVLFIAGFLPWYHVGGSVTVGGVSIGNLPSINRNGWQSPGAMWSVLPILIGLAMAAVVVVRKVGKEGTLPNDVGGVTWPKILLGGGIAGLVCLALKLLNHSGNLSYGFYLGFVAVAALAVGGYLEYRAETPQLPPGGPG
jgi:hypothetical protein